MVHSNEEIGVLFLGKVIITGRKACADRRFWAALADDGELFQRVVRFVNASILYPVDVDWEATLERRAGYFSKSTWGPVEKLKKTCGGPSIRRFKKETVEICLIDFPPQKHEYSYLEELDAMGLRPADFAEADAFGDKYPREVERSRDILAPGSVWHMRNEETGEQFVMIPHLRWDEERRCVELALTLRDVDHGLSHSLRIAAVPK